METLQRGEGEGQVQTGRVPLQSSPWKVTWDLCNTYWKFVVAVFVGHAAL